MEEVRRIGSHAGFVSPQNSTIVPGANGCKADCVCSIKPMGWMSVVGRETPAELKTDLAGAIVEGQLWAESYPVRVSERKSARQSADWRAIFSSFFMRRAF